MSVTGRVRFPGMMMLIQLEKQIRSLLSQLKQIDIIGITCLFILERIQHKQADSVEKRARLASVVSAVSIAPN